jgi:hypothetical protein
MAARHALAAILRDARQQRPPQDEARDRMRLETRASSALLRMRLGKRARALLR